MQPRPTEPNKPGASNWSIRKSRGASSAYAEGFVFSGEAIKQTPLDSNSGFWYADSFRTLDFIFKGKDSPCK